MKSSELRHRVGSLLIVGVEAASLTATEAAWLRGLQPGGLILFRRNIEAPKQVHSLFKHASSILTQPFFRCIDLEGGTVDRLRDLIGATPSAAEVAATGDSKLFLEHGAFIGRTLHTFGFNVDLAPVLDLALPSSLHVLGTRAVSADPVIVVEYASQFLAGLARHNVLGCAKHFPGLGGGTLDSHDATPHIKRTWNQIWEKDLAPYRALAPCLTFTMVNHAAYPKIERTTPASLSHFWIHEVLRRKIGYRGLVISDDMEMGGVLNHTSLGEAAVAAVAAGTDVLEICHRADRVLETHEALLREAERSRAFAARIDAAARRVAQAKRNLLRNDALPRPLSPAGLQKLKDVQNHLREKIATANLRSAE